MSARSTTSRRSLVAGLAIAPTLCASTVSYASPSDRALIELGARFNSVTASLDHYIDNGMDVPMSELEQLGSIESEILSLQATTIDGLRVKARAACWTLLGDIDPTAGQTTDARMALSIVRDLIRQFDGQLENPGALKRLANAG